MLPCLSYHTYTVPFLALRIRPILWASCLRDPPWADIWIRTLASGRSKEVSATCNQRSQTYTEPHDLNILFELVIVHIHFFLRHLFSSILLKKICKDEIILSLCAKTKRGLLKELSWLHLFAYVNSNNLIVWKNTMFHFCVYMLEIPWRQRWCWL